jgi:tRNA dimethylallyltransferase
MAFSSSPLHVPVLLGPTAAGKSALALAIAERKGWEIISCDSRQIYRFMDIGTAKPSEEERTRVRHHLVDIVDPDALYSVHAFVNDATAAIRDCARRGKVGFICGGTGLYFEGLRHGIGPRVESDPAVRESLLARATLDGGAAALHAELMEKDPDSAARIHSNDVQRTVRALAVYYQTGARLSTLQKQTVPPADLVFKTAVVVPPRELLYGRINDRVDRMVRLGLWDEFRELQKKGYHDRSPGLLCVGYRELFAVERGECSLKDAIEKIKQNSRRYAKRQITWFGRRGGGAIADYCDDAAALETRVEKTVSF